MRSNPTPGSFLAKAEKGGLGQVASDYVFGILGEHHLACYCDTPKNVTTSAGYLLIFDDIPGFQSNDI